MLPLALTLGDPAGIGPDIALRAWLERNHHALPPFYIIGRCEILATRAALLGIDVPLSDATPAQAADMFPTALPVVACGADIAVAPGHPDSASASLVIGSIRQAVSDVMAGHASAIVTNPIAKSVLYRAGFTHPGHTEFLAALAHQHTGDAAQPVMMLWSDKLAVVPVTIHLALRKAIESLDTQHIVSTCRIVHREMQSRFGIAAPRLAIAGLNPHAGEDGAMGDEEQRIIQPAIARLRAEGIAMIGPLPADTMFHESARASYDCAIGMYHDQALIPIKTLAFDEAVNVTLGLPFIRTSPDHGTAFDIAGTGKARATSLISAIKLAARMAARQTP